MDVRPKNNGLKINSDFRFLKKTLSLFVIIGIITFVIAFSSLWGGKQLDAKLGTSPWMMILLGVLGFLLVAGFIIASALHLKKSMTEDFPNGKDNEHRND